MQTTFREVIVRSKKKNDILDYVITSWARYFMIKTLFELTVILLAVAALMRNERFRKD